MSAYIIMIRDHMKDEDAFGVYAKAARAASKGHDLTPLAFYGACETLEGAEADGVVIMRFPDGDAARAWYNSPEYSAAREHRFKGSDYRVIVVEGL